MGVAYGTTLYTYTAHFTNHPELTADAWKKVPGWLENPAAAYLSKGQGDANRVVLLAPELLAGYPVVMVIEPNPGVIGDPAGKASTEQLLVTVFAKTNGSVPLADAAKRGQLLYLQKEMALAISHSGGVQFPKHNDISTGRAKIPGYRKMCIATLRVETEVEK